MVSMESGVLVFLGLIAFAHVEGASWGPTFQCRLTCPQDQFLDEQQCRCVYNNWRKCPSLYCPTQNYFPCRKFKNDHIGCPTCECEEESTPSTPTPPPRHERECPKSLTQCRPGCQFGTELIPDVATNGRCRVCVCKKAPTPTLCREVDNARCPQCCPWGSARLMDADGCPSYWCYANSRCARLVGCYLQCPHGYQTDGNKCATCRCKEVHRPQETYPLNCPPVCYMYCPNGNVLNRNGCPICECRKTAPSWSWH